MATNATVDAAAVPVPGAKNASNPPQTIAIYVGDISPEVTDSDLYTEFSKVREKSLAHDDARRRWTTGAFCAAVEPARLRSPPAHFPDLFVKK